MTAILTFDDGRRLQRSTLAMTGMYALMAEAMPTGSTRLQRWLADVSQRAALQALEEKFGPDFLHDPHAHSANCLAELVAMRDDPTRGPRDEILARQPVRSIDLDDLWFD